MLQRIKERLSSLLKVTQQVRDGAGFDLISKALLRITKPLSARERPKTLSQHFCGSVLRPLCSVKFGESKWPCLSEMNRARPRLRTMEGEGPDAELSADLDGGMARTLGRAVDELWDLVDLSQFGWGRGHSKCICLGWTDGPIRPATYPPCDRVTAT